MLSISLNWHREKVAQIDSLNALLPSITCQGPFVQGGDGCQGEAGRGGSKPSIFGSSPEGRPFPPTQWVSPLSPERVTPPPLTKGVIYPP